MRARAAAPAARGARGGATAGAYSTIHSRIRSRVAALEEPRSSRQPQERAVRLCFPVLSSGLSSTRQEVGFNFLIRHPSASNGPAHVN
eukprot:COSAG02_NODE_541_length_20598_cov_278.953754_17_plen_88_part_00